MALRLEPRWSHPARVSPVLRRLRGHTGDLNSLAFLPGDRRLVSAAEDGSVRVWDVTSGGQLAQLAGHTGPVNRLALSPDGACLASAGDGCS